MRRLALTAVTVLAAAFALAVAGCGGDSGGGSVPNDAIAVVDGKPIAKSEFDALISQARASYKAQKRDFPEAGTPEYATLKSQAVQFLVQRVQFELKADELGVEVGDEAVDKRLEQIKKQYFQGDAKKYEAQLKQQGLTDEQVRKDVRAQLVQEGIFNKVTESVKVSPAEIEKYYNEHRELYGQPESRDVRHILVNSKKLADDLHAQLVGGADFAALAKKNSKDPGSASQGGKLTVSKGQTVPEFDKTAFELKVDELSKPVKTQYGWHIIQAVSAVKPAKTTPLKDVEDQIRQQLLQTERSKAMTDWVQKTKEEFDKDTSYQVGFAPPKTGTTATTSTDR